MAWCRLLWALLSAILSCNGVLNIRNIQCCRDDVFLENNPEFSNTLVSSTQRQFDLLVGFWIIAEKSSDSFLDRFCITF